MTTPAPSSAPVPPRASSRSLLITTVVRRFTYPAERPFISLVLYYLLLIAVFGSLTYFVPELRALISGERLANLAGIDKKSVLEAAVSPGGHGNSWFSWRLVGALGFAMFGSLLLMLPTSWVYMSTRRRKGFDQHVVHTMVLLAVSVAGVVMIVQNSLALAFGLAGIVAAVRFRSTLADSQDTLFIFLAIGVGLAAGVEALAAAALLSMIFNFTMLWLVRYEYGMCELGSSPGYLLVEAKKKDAKLPADQGGKKAPDFNSVLLVRTRAVSKAQSSVEALLSNEAKRYRLAEVEENQNGEAVLKYLLRLGKRVDPTQLEDAILRLGPTVAHGARVH